MSEPDQELSMIHISIGSWLLGIDLVGEESVTKNPLGFIHITGDENLYHMEVDGVEKDPVEVMEQVQELAAGLGIKLDDFLDAIKKLGLLVEDDK